MCVAAEDVLGSFFGRHTRPPSADIPAAPAAVESPAEYPPLAKTTAWTRSAAQRHKRAPEEEPLSLNNIVACPHTQSGMVFREPLHLGLGSPLMRDLLSGARGEMSSMSLEMADTNPWLFRNDTHSGAHCTAKVAAAGSARASVSCSTAAQRSAPVLHKRARSAETARHSRAKLPPQSDWSQDGWFTSAGGMAQPSGSKGALHTDSSRVKADLLQAPSPAIAVVDSSEEQAQLSPCTSVSSSNSSLSSLDDADEQAVLAAAGGNRAPGILRRARLLASALLLSVSVPGGYRPIGRQWRLAKPGQPAAAPAIVSIVLVLSSSFTSTVCRFVCLVMHNAMAMHGSHVSVQGVHTCKCFDHRHCFG